MIDKIVKIEISPSYSLSEWVMVVGKYLKVLKISENIEIVVDGSKEQSESVLQLLSWIGLDWRHLSCTEKESKECQLNNMLFYINEGYAGQALLTLCYRKYFGESKNIVVSVNDFFKMISIDNVSMEGKLDKNISVSEDEFKNTSRECIAISDARTIVENVFPFISDRFKKYDLNREMLIKKISNHKHEVYCYKELACLIME